MRNLRHKEFVTQVATAGLRADAEPKAIKASFFEAYPEARGQMVPMGEVRYRRWNMDPIEQYCLAAIAAVRKPKRIFEIGTFDGATSLLLSRMVPEAHVYTLDLRPDEIGGPDALLTRAHANVGGMGSRLRGVPEASRITQLYGDSRQFDFSPYFGQIDLVVVDGGHDADCVVPDTDNALRMVAPEGMVVWDDYTASWPAVVDAVDGAAKRFGLRVVRLVPTDIAVYDTTKV